MFSIIEYVTRTVKRHSEEQAHLIGEPGVPALLWLCMLVIDEVWHKVASPEAGVHVAGLARQARHLGLSDGSRPMPEHSNPTSKQPPSRSTRLQAWNMPSVCTLASCPIPQRSA
jgi:hypothetical protein